MIKIANNGRTVPFDLYYLVTFFYIHYRQQVYQFGDYLIKTVELKLATDNSQDICKMRKTCKMRETREKKGLAWDNMKIN